MRAKRMTAEQIGKVIGRTPDAIYSFLRYVPAEPGKAASLKATDRLPPKPKPEGRSDYWTIDEIRTLRSLADSGVSIKEAAQALGRTPTAVRTKASLLEVRFRHAGTTICRIEQETKHFREDAMIGSAMLLDALMRLAA
jgi:hypothetical protein